MTENEIVKMSAKGQLVVPEDIRKEEDFKPGDRFVPVAIEEGVLFKRIKIPDIKAEFEKLTGQVEEKFKKAKVTDKAIAEAVKWARQKS